jgi:hypothetical protein
MLSSSSNAASGLEIKRMELVEKMAEWIKANPGMPATGQAGGTP